MSPKQLKILRLLMLWPKGLYQSEMISRSNGFLTRGTVYATVERLEKDGWITGVVEPPTHQYKMERIRYTITIDGRVAVTEFAEEMNFLFGERVDLSRR